MISSHPSSRFGRPTSTSRRRGICSAARASRDAGPGAGAGQTMGLNEAVDHLIEFGDVEYEPVEPDRFDRNIMRPPNDMERRELRRAREQGDEAVRRAVPAGAAAPTTGRPPADARDPAVVAEADDRDAAPARGAHDAVPARPLRDRLPGDRRQLPHVPAESALPPSRGRATSRSSCTASFAIRRCCGTSTTTRTAAQPEREPRPRADGALHARRGQRLHRERHQGSRPRPHRLHLRGRRLHRPRLERLPPHARRRRRSASSVAARAGSTATTSCNVIFSQRAVSEFICLKLYRYFVHDMPNGPDEGTHPRSSSDTRQALPRRPEYELKPVLRALFRSAALLRPVQSWARRSRARRSSPCRRSARCARRRATCRLLLSAGWR
jgi:hypothetical protein